MSEEVVLIADSDLDRPAPAAYGERLCVRLEVATADWFREQHPKVGCELLLLLDSSASMNDRLDGQSGMTKRAAVVAAVQSMVRSLDPMDRVSIAFFDDRAFSIAESIPGDEGPRIVQEVRKIDDYNGATNFQAAFELAARWAQRASQASRRIVFLTDGQSTRGSMDVARRIDAELAQAGVTVDCLGLGTDFAFDEMQALSAPSNGMTHRLAAPAEAGTVFGELLRGAQRSLVQGALLRIQIPTGFRDIELYQCAPEVRYCDDLVVGRDGAVRHTVRVGSVEQHRPSIYMLKMTVDTPPQAARLKVAEWRLDYTVPALSITGGRAGTTTWLEVAAGPGMESRDGDVTLLYREVSLSRLEREFRAVQSRDWQAAARILSQMLRIAEEVGVRDKVQTYREMRSRLEQHHGLTRDELNRLFARTSRSTLAQAGRTGAPTAPAF